MKLTSAFLLTAVLSLNASDLQLPDPLTTQSGQKVDSPEMWKASRRPEILELFRENVYGRAPVGRPKQLKFEVTDLATNAMDGKAVRKQVKISFQGPGGEGAIHLILFVPNGVTGPVPCLLLICNRGPENIDPTRQVKSPFWPAENIVARGSKRAHRYSIDRLLKDAC